MSDNAHTFRPPYMSFQTFWKFINELGAKPLPPRIDRSMMHSKSGTDQANLAMALTSFGLTDSEGRVQPPLVTLTSATDEDRRAALADLIRRYYPGPTKVAAENGTQAALSTAFADDYTALASGETRRKAITFYLHAATTAELPLSPHFPATRAGSGAPGASKPRKTAAKRKSSPVTPADPPRDMDWADPDPSAAPPRAARGTSHTVELESGGSLTLTYELNLFDLDEADESFVLGLIRQLRNYAKQHDEAVEVDR